MTSIQAPPDSSASGLNGAYVPLPPSTPRHSPSGLKTPLTDSPTLSQISRPTSAASGASPHALPDFLKRPPPAREWSTAPAHGDVQSSSTPNGSLRNGKLPLETSTNSHGSSGERRSLMLGVASGSKTSLERANGSPTPHFKLNDRSFSFTSSAAAPDQNDVSSYISDDQPLSRTGDDLQPPSSRSRTSSREQQRRSTSDFEEPTAEDEASAHVREVYAHLDLYGVPGDGYADGVELTREKRGRSASPELERRASTKSMVQGEDGLAAKERDVLRKADRYGFFEESHKRTAGGMTRVTVLPKVPLTTFPPTSIPVSTSSRLPFPRSPSSKGSPRMGRAGTNDSTLLNGSSLGASLSDPSISELTYSPQSKRESRRIAKWSDMLIVTSRDEGGNAQTWDLAPGFSLAKFRRRCWKGVPDRWRRAAWSVLLDGFGRRERWGEVVGMDEKGVTGKRHSPSASMASWKEHGAAEASGSGQTTPVPWGDKEALGKRYRDAVDTPSQQDVQIDLDVPRTISGNVYFHTRYGKGQRALFHVLHAWGLHCATCGYCQGMGPVAATFLSYYEAEAAYACLLTLHDRYGLHAMFAPGFPGLVECFYVQERLIEALMPDVYKAFTSQMISSSAYATKWYITIFANTVPYRSQLRLWDVFLLEGPDILVVAAVSIVWAFRDRLTSASFETILSLLSCYFLVEDDDIWLEWIRRVAKRRKVRELVRSWREEWKGFVRDGTAQSKVT